MGECRGAWGAVQPSPRSRRSQTRTTRARQATPTALKPGRPPWTAPRMKSTPAAPYRAAVARGGSPLFSIAQLLVWPEPEKREAGHWPGFVPWLGRAWLAPWLPEAARRRAVAPGWGRPAPTARNGGMAVRMQASAARTPASTRRAQFALWMARLSTAMAASWIASDRVGWAWQM